MSSEPAHVWFFGGPWDGAFLKAEGTMRDWKRHVFVDGGVTSGIPWNGFTEVYVESTCAKDWRDDSYRPTVYVETARSEKYGLIFYSWRPNAEVA